MISIQEVNYFNQKSFPKPIIFHPGLSLIIQQQDLSINRNIPMFFLLQRNYKSKLKQIDGKFDVLQVLLNFSLVLKKTEFFTQLKTTREIEQISYLLFTHYHQEDAGHSVDQIIKLLVNRTFKVNSEIINNDHSLIKLIEFMENNIYDSLHVVDFCSVVHMSESSLNRLCKKQAGMTATKLFRKIQCQEAGRLLKETSLTVQEISEKLGFKNSKHFSTLFKRHEGLSPIEERRMWRDSDNE